MGERNCRTTAELHDETTRLYGILTNAIRPDPKAFEEAASRARNLTLALVMERLEGSCLPIPTAAVIATRSS